MSPLEQLHKERIAISEIDDKIMELLDQRLEHIQNVGNIKKEHNLPILNNEVETMILSRCKTNFTHLVYRELMRVSREMQKPTTVTYR